MNQQQVGAVVRLPEQGVDDLADVIIARPVPNRYSITEVEGAEFVLRQAEYYSVPWTAAKLADFMEALGSAWEAKAELERQQDATPAAHEKGGVGAAAAKAGKLARIKLLLRNGESIIDIPAILDWTFEELVGCIVGGNKNAAVCAWGDIEWLRFEALIAGPGPFKLVPVAKAIGLSRRAAETLLRLYDKEITYEARNLSNPIGPMIAAAVAENPHIGTVEMRTMIEAAGLTPPKDSALRQRIRDARRSRDAERVSGGSRGGVLTVAVA